MLSKSVVICIVGPTAMGKTRIAMRVARRSKGEIISADSMQAYRGMVVVSQAPSAVERRAIRHHLIGILSPGMEYGAAIFARRASRAIADIIRRGKTPIVAGGSGLYVKALVDGLFPSPAADSAFRKKMGAYVTRYGSAKIHERLMTVDPAAALSIHPNDARRIIRALEIYHSTGKTMSELKRTTKGIGAKYDVRIFGLTMARAKLYRKINERVDGMFADGIVEEVRRLISRRPGRTASAALGYSEIAGNLRGLYDETAARELLKMNTRRYAKRQWTWFRADPRIRWLDTDRMSEGGIVKNILRVAAGGRAAGGKRVTRRKHGG